MPRPNPPPPLATPIVSPFKIENQAQCDLAEVLGLKRLPRPIADAIAHAISCYKATEAGTPDTTVGNTLAELAELKKSGRAYHRSVARVADDASGVDYTTHGVLQPLAKGVLAGESGARERLAEAADVVATQLRHHPRVQTATEPLRLFCGILREIFKHVASPPLQPPIGDGWYHCRQFAMEVFTVAGIDCADFDAHPERLTAYLGTEI